MTARGPFGAREMHARAQAPATHEQGKSTSCMASRMRVRWSTSQEATSSRREGFTAAFGMGTATSNTGNSFGLC